MMFVDMEIDGDNDSVAQSDDDFGNGRFDGGICFSLRFKLYEKLIADYLKELSLEAPN